MEESIADHNLVETKLFDSAIGDEVNMAARLASKAAAGEIIVSERALEKANMDGSHLESRSLELKGICMPVRVRVMRS